VCPEADVCLVSSCDAALGCVIDPVNCDDGDDCTIDTCVEEFVCVVNPASCSHEFDTNNPNCNTACFDTDGDGFEGAACGGTDCNDFDANIFPGAPELCDGEDNNCDGTIDENFVLGGPCGSDVGECMLGIYTCAGSGGVVCSGESPPSIEVCGDFLDNDCDGKVDEGCD